MQDMTIEYIYPDLSKRSIRVCANVITVCDVLADAERLMVVDLDEGTSNDPHGTMANRRRGAECPPCQRRITYFDHLRHIYGEAGLLKSELGGEEVWEFRFG